ncbi:hypothetical protein [Pengzhenrongella frigida]|uniref:hypothetical protein n=1 Tax=Pengzhenrongella frigida TaxID=1259133 RepID=UPI0013ED9809|nr:hypothetical protein [Cellulomonas sp. HLT2-17]
MPSTATREILVPRLSPTRSHLVPLITTAALVATVLAPWLAAHHPRVLVAAVAAIAALVVAAWLARRSAASDGAASDGAASAAPAVTVGSTLRSTVELALHLSPVLLLTVIFPIASVRISTASVGGADLSALLLASSLTVPWLSQAVCFPLYRAIGPLISDGDRFQIAARFCQVWPATFIQSAPVIVVFAIPVQIVMRWSPAALGTYVALCLLHMAFVQSLVPTNVGRRRVLWAAAWVGYAAALLLVPTWWFLPPLVGLATQLVPLRAHLARVGRPVWLDNRDLLSDLTRGVLLGGVLWSDKFFLYLRGSGQFDVSATFFAMLPAVLAYNYYFVRLAPAFDTSVGSLRAAMENSPYAVLADRSSRLSRTVQASISQTAVIGAGLCLAITVLVTQYTTYSAALVASVAVASWLFMMTTVLCYKLDYAGKTGLAQVYSAAHLVVCGGAFLLLPAGANLYGALLAFEALLFAAALRSCLNHWRSAEYTLFWRHATAW